MGTRVGLAFLRLDPEDKKPLNQQLYDQLRKSVLDGWLDPGVQLPPSRQLAKDMKISRNTVVNAYAQLTSEGYLEAIVGAGTFVSRQLPEDLSRVAGRQEAAAVSRELVEELSSRGEGYLSRLRGSGPRHPFVSPERVFTIGLPDLEEFPWDRWRRLSSRVQKRLSPWGLGYASPLGFLPLRQAIASHIKAARGVRCEPDQIVITNGSQQALFLVASILLDPGDRVWVEDPGYPGARRAMAGAGAQIQSVGLDEQGLNLELGLGWGRPPRLVYLTPSRQFPMGMTMPLARRLELLRWAEEERVWLIEDDYDSEFRYEGRPVPALQGLDGSGRVLYVGTFSKTMFPALRLGYLLLPPPLVQAVVAARLAQDLNPSLLDQAVLAEFIEEGDFERHVRRMRVLYGRRGRALVESLKDGIGHRLTVPDIEAGMHLALPLPKGSNDWSVAGVAIDHKVQAAPLSVYCSEKRDCPGLVLGFAAAKEKAIRGGARRLSRALLESLSPLDM